MTSVGKAALRSCFSNLGDVGWLSKMEVLQDVAALALALKKRQMFSALCRLDYR
jgi:uncharacterized membrane protein